MFEYAVIVYKIINISIYLFYFIINSYVVEYNNIKYEKLWYSYNVVGRISSLNTFLNCILLLFVRVFTSPSTVYYLKFLYLQLYTRRKCILNFNSFRNDHLCNIKLTRWVSEVDVLLHTCRLHCRYAIWHLRTRRCQARLDVQEKTLQSLHD